MKPWDVCVIGGGAAGIVSALKAKSITDSVILLERNNRIGKKLLATGNGRCNFTNAQASKDHYNHPDFVESLFEQFGPSETLDYFESLGITPKIEDEGKTYPMSEQASSFLDVFLYEIEQAQLTVWTDALVTKIEKTSTFFRICLLDQRIVEAKTIVLATGGKAMPKSGSDGNGYALATQLGHHITDIHPSLTKMTVDAPYLKALDGTKIHAIVSLWANGVLLQQEEGDFLWTDYGVSGPTILQLSRLATRKFYQHQSLELRVNVLPEMTPSHLYDRFSRMGDKPIGHCLIGLIHKRMIPVVLKSLDISSAILVDALSKEQQSKLIKRLFDWPLSITGFKSYDDAQATIGGVFVDEIQSRTLASKLVKGLYFAGEIIDIDGLCGGYNLQWAWTSGIIAGENAAKEASDDTNL